MPRRERRGRKCTRRKTARFRCRVSSRYVVTPCVSYARRAVIPADGAGAPCAIVAVTTALAAIISPLAWSPSRFGGSVDLPRRGRPRRSLGPLTLAAFLSWPSAQVTAQGVTTAAIHGSVRAENGADVDGTPVRVVNRATGFLSETRVRNGHFIIPGLETGGPYTVGVRRVGFAPQADTVSYLNIGERREVDFVLAVTRLAPVVAGADRVDALSARGRGVGSSISDSTLRRLPTLNGDLYDFLRLAPQVGTRLGLSGGGAPFRFNEYSIDGLSERLLQNNGNGAGAGSLTSSSNRTISLEAVKEYQVLLSPFDVRYGDFTGLLVNAVTKAGTNDLHGSVYAHLRNAQLARSGSFLGTSSSERAVYGFSVGGPLVHNRIQFFIAPEIQRATQPARGPWVGQGADALVPLPVSPDTVARFSSLLRDRGLAPGDGGRVMLPNPNVALFGRMDFSLPELASRLVLRESYSRGSSSGFQRNANTRNFQLTSVAGVNRQTKRTTAAQLFSQLSPAVFNEFQFGHTDNPIGGGGGVSAHMPSISVNAGGAMLVAGTAPGAQGGGASAASTEIGDYIVFEPGPNHTFGFGAHIEFFRYALYVVKAAWGQWAFQGLDAVAAGTPSSFTIGRDFGSAASPVTGAEPSLYASDEWRLNDRVSITLGLRADGLAFSQHPAYNPDVDSVFHRRTSDFPRFRPQWSPRLGFMWQPDDDRRTSIRGGAGLFVGRPPLGWLDGPMRSDGTGIRTLLCAAGNVPAFTPAAPPTTCKNGSGPVNGAVTLVDQNLRMAETLRASIGVDQRLPWNLIGDVEALYSRVRSDFGFFNLALGGPTDIDSHGRVMYGSFDADGAARPSPVAGNPFSEVVDLRNQGGGYSWSVTGQLRRPWSDRLEMGVSYTYSRVRDVRSITSNMTAMPLDLWAGERPSSGRLDDGTLGVSAFEIPHRLVLSATYAARWKRQTTDISLYYIGESGVPFTYGDSTAGKFTGDLNADGTAADDPIYVPRDATDPAEIAFHGGAGGQDSVTAQGVAFEKFIRGTPCLNQQRGRIVARNSCRTAWVNTSNLSVRQSLPAFGGHAATIQLEIFNVLNLLNKSWGLFEVPSPWILQNAGRTKAATPQPLFTFITPARNVQNAESSYQLQLSLRYSF